MTRSVCQKKKVNTGQCHYYLLVNGAMRVFQLRLPNYKRDRRDGRTLEIFLCSMSVITAYTLRKSERFCLAMYNCLSSCSFNANYDSVSP